MKPVFFFLAALVLLVVLSSVSGQRGKGMLGVTAFEPDLDAALEGVKVVATKDGEVLWRLSTEQATMPSSGSVANLGKVDLEVPREGLIIKSGSGVYDLDNNDLMLTDGITADTGQMLLRSDHASLDAKTGEVVSDADVVVVGNGFVVRGHGFWAKGREVKVISSVVASIE